MMQFKHSYFFAEPGRVQFPESSLQKIPLHDGFRPSNSFSHHTERQFWHFLSRQRVWSSSQFLQRWVVFYAKDWQEFNNSHVVVSFEKSIQSVVNQRVAHSGNFRSVPEGFARIEESLLCPFNRILPAAAILRRSRRSVWISWWQGLSGNGEESRQ